MKKLFVFIFISFSLIAWSQKIDANAKKLLDNVS